MRRLPLRLAHVHCPNLVRQKILCLSPVLLKAPAWRKNQGCHEKDWSQSKDVISMSELRPEIQEGSINWRSDLSQEGPGRCSVTRSFRIQSVADSQEFDGDDGLLWESFGRTGSSFNALSGTSEWHRLLGHVLLKIEINSRLITGSIYSFHSKKSLLYFVIFPWQLCEMIRKKNCWRENQFNYKSNLYESHLRYRKICISKNIE